MSEREKERERESREGGGLLIYDSIHKHTHGNYTGIRHVKLYLHEYMCAYIVHIQQYCVNCVEDRAVEAKCGWKAVSVAAKWCTLNSTATLG